MIKDYYKILEIPFGASKDDIKSSYRSLALQFHPDVCKDNDASEKFIEINEAYQVLNDDQKKQDYDFIYQQYFVKQSYEPSQDVEQNIRNINNWAKQARDNANEARKKNFQEFLRTQDCYFYEKSKADGKPYAFYVHRTTGIAGGSGPMGSIKGRVVKILIPRSKKAERLHTFCFYFKLSFLLILFVFLRFTRFQYLFTWKYIPFIILYLLIIGGICHLIYYLNSTKSVFYYARRYPLVRKYLKNNYHVGSHTMISTTPFGIIYFLLKWLV